MRSKEQVHALVCEAAEGLNLQQLVEETDRIAWLLQFDDETAIDVEYNLEDDHLVLTSAVWEVVGVQREAIYELLLQFNYLWTETGGVRMALDGMPGQVVMLFDVPDPATGATQLRRVLGNITKLQKSWRQILSAYGDAPSDSPAPDEEAMHGVLEQLVQKP